MRAIKQSLLVLSLSICLLTFFAGAASAAIGPGVGEPSVIPGPTTLSLTGDVYNGGQSFDYRFEYFVMDATENCMNPDAGDLEDLISTEWTTVGSASSATEVTATLSGLSTETSYCYRLSARNEDGQNSSYFWSSTTTAFPSDVSNASFDGGTNSIDYSVDFTPNFSNPGLMGWVDIEYFVKGFESCNDHSGAPQVYSDYGGEATGWDGWRGDSPVTVEGSLGGLSTDTIYCVRVSANAPYGGNSTDWQEVQTISPKPAEISDVKFGPSITGSDADLTFSVNDMGAVEDTGGFSTIEVGIWDIGEGRCNESEYFGGDNVFFAPETNFSSGIADRRFGIDDLTLGKPYCVTVWVKSAWGSSYDVTTHTEVWFGETAGIESAGVTDVTHNSIAYSSTVWPGHLKTNYGAEYFAKQPAAECDEAVDPDLHIVPAGVITENLGTSQPKTATITGLAPETTYCVTYFADNYWGAGDTGWEEVTTEAEPFPATIGDINVGPRVGGGAKVTAVVNDSGASIKTGSASVYLASIWDTPADQCNSSGYATGLQVVGSMPMPFGGEATASVEAASLAVGHVYCARVYVNSAWDDMDAQKFQPFTFGDKPAVEIGEWGLGGFDLSLNNAKVSPKYAATDYELQYFPMTDHFGICGMQFITRGSTADTVGEGSITDDLGDQHTLGTMTAESLTPDTGYCFRLSATNKWGTTTTDWISFITDIERFNSTLGSPMFSASNVVGKNLTIDSDIDDNGAGQQADADSVYWLMIFDLPSSSCNSGGVAGQTAVSDGYHSSGFRGTATKRNDVALTPGTTYCVKTWVDSAWGDSYDATKYTAFRMPATPSVTDLTVNTTHTSITMSGTLAATWQDIGHYISYYTYPGSGTCTGGASQIAGTAEQSGSVTESPHQISSTLASLDPDTSLCVRFEVAAEYGSFASDWQLVTTPEDEAPTKPAGLTASNVTTSGATISWDHSSDNKAVDHYVVKSADAGPLGSIAYPQKTIQVSLTCGATRSFTVTAVDAVGNESAASDPLSVTGACPLPPDKFCFAKFSKTVKGSTKKKKSFKLTITGKPSGDGQSITFTVKSTQSKDVKPTIYVAGKKKGTKATVSALGQVKVQYFAKGKKKTLKPSYKNSKCD